MFQKLICVLGGTGFVGEQLVSVLTKAGYRVRIPSRNRERRRDVLVLPQVDVVDADVHDPATLNTLFQDCFAVINLVAILNEQGDDTFEKVHVELPRKIVDACRHAGVSRLLHMSALNADAQQGASAYLRSKGQGEAIVHGADELHVTSFRPSVIFGPGDHFFNRFAGMLHALPMMPLMCPQARMAPVYVSDVVTAMAKTLREKTTYGQRYDLCGPEVFTLLDLVEYTRRLLKVKRRIIPLSDGLSALHGKILGKLPGKLFTYDNYLSLQTPAVCSAPFPEMFGIEPACIDSIVPKYVGREDIRGRFDSMRRHAARDA